MARPIETEKLLLVGVLALSPVGTKTHAVTEKPSPLPSFVMDPSQFRSSVSLPVAEQKTTTSMPVRKIKARIRRSASDPRVEPIVLHVATDGDRDVQELSRRLAAAGDTAALVSALELRRNALMEKSPGAAKIQIEVDPNLLALMDSAKLADLYDRSHHEVTVKPSLLSDYRVAREFLNQVEPFFDDRDHKHLAASFAHGTPISVDKELLPEFARKMVGRYLVYRGPNCFHAALAFHSPRLTRSSLVNVREEEGYHRAMINFDELWRVLNSNFYEVDARTLPLKYGDILVFFDVPGEGEPISFRMIRHTAVYLFGGYTFSKGSKSPNTTYTVNTLAEEWNNWAKRAKQLGVKVFRNAHPGFVKAPPKSLEEWIY